MVDRCGVGTSLCSLVGTKFCPSTEAFSREEMGIPRTTENLPTSSLRSTRLQSARSSWSLLSRTLKMRRDFFTAELTAERSSARYHTIHTLLQLVG